MIGCFFCLKSRNIIDSLIYSKMKSKFYSKCAAFVFIILIGFGCIHPPIIRCATVKERIIDNSVLEKKSFIELNNGTRVYGTKLKSPFFKNVTSIDGKEFNNSEVRGYSYGGHYYLFFSGKEFLRLVEGFVSVYKLTEMSAGSGSNSSRNVCNIYAKKGPDGVLTVIRFPKELQDFVKDCGPAYAMVNMSDNEIRELIKKDPMYLNKVFETYNNNCK